MLQQSCCYSRVELLQQGHSQQAHASHRHTEQLLQQRRVRRGRRQSRTTEQPIMKPDGEGDEQRDSHTSLTLLRHAGHPAAP